MNKLNKIIMLSIIVVGVNIQAVEINTEDKKSEFKKEMCKIYKEKIIKYKTHMRDDEYARKTLSNYIKIEKENCNKTSI